MTEKTSRPYGAAAAHPAGQPEAGIGPQSQSHELRFASSRPTAAPETRTGGEDRRHD